MEMFSVIEKSHVTVITSLSYITFNRHIELKVWLKKIALAILK